MAQPDYTALLRGYPGLAEQIAAINAQGLSDAGQATLQRRRSLVEFGNIPGNLGADVNRDIDEETRRLAAAANRGGVSTVAQLGRGYGLANQQDAASLAARGLLRSGALAQHQGENLANFQRQSYGANQALQDRLGQIQQGYLGQQSGLRQQAYGATQDALQGILGQIQAGQIGGGAGVSTGVGAAAPSSGTNYRVASAGIASANAPGPRPYKPPAAPSASTGLSRALRYG